MLNSYKTVLVVSISHRLKKRYFYTTQLVSIPVIALYDYKAAENNELSFKADEKLTIIICEEDSWWMAKNASGKTGLVPANYVEKIKEDQKKTFPAVKEQQKVASKEVIRLLIDFRTGRDC